LIIPQGGCGEVAEHGVSLLANEIVQQFDLNARARLNPTSLAVILPSGLMNSVVIIY
jgi:hypothetical protein